MLDSTTLVALRAAIFINPVAAALLAAGNVPGLQSWCNAASTTRRWLPAAPIAQVEQAPNYTTFDNLSQGKRDSWLLFLNRARDFGEASVRDWVVAVWGNATSGSDSEKVLLAGTVFATNAQVAINGAAGTETKGTVSAIDVDLEVPVSEDDVKTLIFKDNGTIWTP